MLAQFGLLTNFFVLAFCVSSVYLLLRKAIWTVISSLTFEYEKNAAVLISQASLFPLNMMNGAP